MPHKGCPFLCLSKALRTVKNSAEVGHSAAGSGRKERTLKNWHNNQAAGRNSKKDRKICTVKERHL